tara:strand:- start:3301 stop:3873 length:573 start_codon:yes stop_codon:yes gene_type:complete
MKTSESIELIATALGLAQKDMGGAVKGSDNPFFKSTYANLSDVMQVIKKPFAENGLSYVQFPLSNENGAGVTTRLMHKSGQWLEQDFVLPMVKKDPQAGGSCVTYARRYALAAMAGVPQVDDDAESAMLRGGDITAPISEEQASQLKRLLEATSSDVDKFCSVFRCSTVDQMQAQYFDKAFKALNSKASK